LDLDNKTHPKLTQDELIQQFNNIVGTKKVLTKLTQTPTIVVGFALVMAQHWQLCFPVVF